MRKDRNIYYKPDPDAGKRKKTAGETIFNEITYRGVDFALNATFGVAFTYWTARTKSGQKVFGEKLYNFFEHSLKPIIKEEENLHKGASMARNFLSIMMGGTAIIPIIMALESNKQQIIQTLDKKIYGEDEVNNNERFSIAYDDIAHEPQKGFWIGMGARFIALAPLFYAEVKHPDACKEFLHKPVGNVTKGIAEFVGIKGTKLKNMKYTDVAGKTDSHWNFLHDTIGMDASLTFFYSFMHEWSYKGLSNMLHKEKHEVDSNQRPEQSVDAKTIIANNHQLTAEPPSTERLI